MDKNTFLLQLQKQLKGLPEEEVQQTVEYYREMLEDRIEEGLSEEEAVKEIGTVEEIAQPLMPKPTRNRKAWELVLLVLGFPVWFSALAAVAAAVISLVVTIYAVNVSFAACFFGGLLSSLPYLFQGNWAGAAFLFGAALVCGGLAIFGFWGSDVLMKGSVKAVKNLFRKGRGL